jgi:uncharacterized RDD family membrane protein YckC
MSNTKYAGFWIRWVADVIDSIFLDIVTCLVALMGLGIIYWFKVLFSSSQESVSFFEVLNPFVLQLILVAIRGGVSFVYFTWATYFFGTTLGKRPFRIYVVTYVGHEPVTLRQSVLRCFGYIASYLPLCAGFIMVLFHPEKRALHDWIAGTVSVIKPSQNSSG